VHLKALAPPALFREIFVYASLPAERFYRTAGYHPRGSHAFELHGALIPTLFMVKRQPR